MKPFCECGGILCLRYSWTPEGLVMADLTCDRCGKSVRNTKNTTPAERMWMIVCGAHAPQKRLDA